MIAGALGKINPWFLPHLSPAIIVSIRWEGITLNITQVSGNWSRVRVSGVLLTPVFSPVWKNQMEFNDEMF